jgi:hypothetical protein
MYCCFFNFHHSQFSQKKPNCIDQILIVFFYQVRVSHDDFEVLNGGEPSESLADFISRSGYHHEASPSSPLHHPLQMLGNNSHVTTTSAIVNEVNDFGDRTGGISPSPPNNEMQQQQKVKISNL